MEQILGANSVSELSSEGELPCVIIYSSSRHVSHIKVTLDFIKEFLKRNKFKIVLLSNEARDLNRYLDEFVKVSEGCVLGIIILDGFRPNVLFEFGILVGLNKPTIILKEKHAQINIKTLFPDIDQRNCRTITGLSFGEFDRLKNPEIDLGLSSQFSDLSTKFTMYDWSASRDELEHVANQLNSCLINITCEIEKESKRMLCEKAPKSMINSDLEEYNHCITELLGLYLGRDASVEKLEEVSDRFKRLESKISEPLPSDIYKMIASAYNSLPEEI